MSLSVVSNIVPVIRFAPLITVVPRLTNIAFPIIALLGFSLVRGVSATPYTDCIDACNQHRDAHELAKLLCYAMCYYITKD
jgi:hypothetical protein